MIKLQESRWFKSLCLLLALAIFNVSCSDASLPNSQQDCLPLEYPITSYEDGDFYFENAIELVHTLNHHNNYSSVEAFIKDVYEEGEETNQFASNYVAELEMYGTMGFEPYLGNVEERGLLSSSFKIALLDLTDNVTNYLTTNHPSLEELKTYIYSQESIIIDLNLCEEDALRVSMILDIYAGYVSYMYNFVPADFQSGSLIHPRDCTWLEAIICGILAVTIGVVVTAFVGVSLFAIVSSTSKGEGFFNVVRDIGLEIYSAYLAIAIGWEAGTSFYNWCCGIEEQVCEPPTGFYIQPQECDEYLYGVYGPSLYSTTSWENSNTDPDTETTNASSIILRVPSIGEISEINANILCISDATGMVFYSHTNTLTFDYNESSSLPTPQWGYAPPSNANVNNTYEISVTLGSDNTTSLSWSVSPFGGSITPISDYAANLTFFTQGDKSVTATFTDLCNGETVSISKEVNVN